MPAARPFPAKTLEQALRVPQALKEKNGGNGWPPAQVAEALGLGGKGGNFYYVAASARDYGLTTGSREAAEIALTELGRAAVYHPLDSSRNRFSARRSFRSMFFVGSWSITAATTFPRSRSWGTHWSRHSELSGSCTPSSLTSSQRTAVSLASARSIRATDLGHVQQSCLSHSVERAVSRWQRPAGMLHAPRPCR